MRPAPAPGEQSRPSWRPTRCAPRSCFLGGYSLLTGVIPALLADTVRPLHALAARTRLNVDGGSDLVRIAGALLPLGGAALRDGHWVLSALRVWLLGVRADRAKRIPPGVRRGRAITPP